MITCYFLSYNVCLVPSVFSIFETMSEKHLESKIFVVLLLMTDSGMNSLTIKLFRIQEIENNLASTSKLCHNFS